jgi:hypothetical protein
MTTAHPYSHELLANANGTPRTSYSAAPHFLVVKGWLEHDGEQILGGPVAALEQFADLLNLLNPPRRMLPQVITACRGMARGSHFTIGEALRRMGVAP